MIFWFLLSIYHPQLDVWYYCCSTNNSERFDRSHAYISLKLINLPLSARGSGGHFEFLAFGTGISSEIGFIVFSNILLRTLNILIGHMPIYH